MGVVLLEIWVFEYAFFEDDAVADDVLVVVVVVFEVIVVLLGLWGVEGRVVGDWGSWEGEMGWG